MNKTMTLLIVLFSVSVWTDEPIEGQIAQAPKQNDRGVADFTETRNIVESTEDYSFATWYKDFSRKWGDETRTLQLKWGFPQEHKRQGNGEVYMASQRQDRIEDKFIDAFDDSIRYSFLEWYWQTPSGQRIVERLKAAELRIELYMRRVNGRGSANDTTVDVIFGEKGRGWPDLGVRVNERPELLVQWTGRGTGRFINNGNGKPEEIRIEHELSWRVANLTDIGDFTRSMRLAYEAKNVIEWVNLNARYHFQSRNIHIFADDIPLGRNMYLGLGVTYHGDGNGHTGNAIFPLEFDDFIAKPGSVTFTAGMDGKFSKATDLLFWRNWRSRSLGKNRNKEI